MTRITSALVLLLAMLLTQTVTAQTVYVVDHLAVGLHESKDLASPIVKLLPTGSALELLQRDDNFVQVRTNDNVEGWVDATYVMDERPAQLALLELEASYVDTRNELEVALAEIESLNSRIESMESAEAGQASNEEATSDALREMQRLAEENQALRTRLSEAQAAVLELERTEADRGSSNSITTAVLPGMLGLSKWHWIMIGALMVLAFGLGGYLVDLGIRRRHGGFRI